MNIDAFSKIKFNALARSSNFLGSRERQTLRVPVYNYPPQREKHIVYKIARVTTFRSQEPLDIAPGSLAISRIFLPCVSAAVAPRTAYIYILCRITVGELLTIGSTMLAQIPAAYHTPRARLSVMIRAARVVMQPILRHNEAVWKKL